MSFANDSSVDQVLLFDTDGVAVLCIARAWSGIPSTVETLVFSFVSYIHSYLVVVCLCPLCKYCSNLI